MWDIDKIKKEFNAYYQTTIDSLLEEHPQLSNLKANVIVRMQSDFIWGKLPKTDRLYNFDKITDFQKSIFYKAVIQQIYYVLTEGDFTGMSGYDVTTNSFLDPNTVRKIALSPNAKQTLKDGGLLYNATSSTVGIRRWRW